MTDQEIETKLPEFIELLKTTQEHEDVVLDHYLYNTNDEILLLGYAIKYACKKGYTVVIVGGAGEI